MRKRTCPSQLDTLLDQLGWSKRELGVRLGMGQSAINSWLHHGVPPYILAYLELAVQVTQDPAAAAQSLEPFPRGFVIPAEQSASLE